MPDSDIYACGRCGEVGIKLWREAHTMMPDLRCVDCLAVIRDGGEPITVEDVREDGTRYSARSGQITDQLGWWLPAVQVLDDQPLLRFWGYTSTPPEDYQHWRDLPLRWKETTDG